MSESEMISPETAEAAAEAIEGKGIKTPELPAELPMPLTKKPYDMNVAPPAPPPAEKKTEKLKGWRKVIVMLIGILAAGINSYFGIGIPEDTIEILVGTFFAGNAAEHLKETNLFGKK